jgi:hypothetical protein
MKRNAFSEQAFSDNPLTEPLPSMSSIFTPKPTSESIEGYVDKALAKKAS